MADDAHVSCCGDRTRFLTTTFNDLNHQVDITFAVSGPSAKASEEDQERTRRLADAEMHRHHLESLLDQRDREITALREVTSSSTMGSITFE